MADIATLKTEDVMGGLSLHVTLSRGFTIRTRIACWLIGLAGRVMDMPCEVEMRSADDFRPGDVVHDLWVARSKSRAARVMTVHSVDDGFVECVWFEGDAVRHSRFRAGSLRKID